MFGIMMIQGHSTISESACHPAWGICYESPLSLLRCMELPLTVSSAGCRGYC